METWSSNLTRKYVLQDKIFFDIRIIQIQIWTYLHISQYQAILRKQFEINIIATQKLPEKTIKSGILTSLTCSYKANRFRYEFYMLWAVLKRFQMTESSISWIWSHKLHNIQLHFNCNLIAIKLKNSNPTITLHYKGRVGKKSQKSIALMVGGLLTKQVPSMSDVLPPRKKQRLSNDESKIPSSSNTSDNTNALRILDVFEHR